MRLVAPIALLALAVLAPASARATDGGVIEFELSQSETDLPIFFLDARVPAPAELFGRLRWTVNGFPVDERDGVSIEGQLFEMKGLPLQRASSVCVEFRGGLRIGGRFVNEVWYRSCLAYVPVDQPRSTEAGDERIREREQRDRKLPRPVLRRP